MWNIIASSKITQTQITKKNYELHLQKLKNIRSSMKIKVPYQPHFIYTKPKLEQTRRQRLIDIDRENGILLNKMDRINQAKVEEPRMYAARSLNQQIASLVKEKIDEENRRICGKLMRISSYYPTGRIISESNKLNRIGVNISENARRCKSTCRLSITRPNSAIPSHQSKFIRSHKENKQEEYLTGRQKSWARPSSASVVRPGSAPGVRTNRQAVEPLVLVDNMTSEGIQEVI